MPEPVEQREESREPTATDRVIAAITNANVKLTLLALFTAFVLGGMIIALSDDAARSALSYVTRRPTDFTSAAWTAVADAYSALFRGSAGSVRAVSESLTAAIPLILAGLAVAVPLRAGMFNIGGEGQVIAGGVVAGLVGFTVTGLPLVIHLPLAVLAGLVGGALYGFLPGLLKARTGAHEVIVTIMLNNIAIFVSEYLLSTTAFQQPGRSDPVSRSVLDSARLPGLSGDLRVHAGVFIVIGAAILMYVLLERSSTGFEIRAVGLNPDAARVAGMSVSRVTILALTVGGAMAGLAGTGQVLGVNHRLTSGFSGGIGFEGITVALLGRGRVGGTVAAGLLFGALRAGGRTMQAQSGTSLDLVVVIQALVIVFVAAPALVSALYRVRTDSEGLAQVSGGWGA